ncbi:MAG TPA: IS256 family transposase [Caulobacteraceae bacterium]|nr:IS256 family transposase [Caulobacteraceae bacterium]
MTDESMALLALIQKSDDDDFLKTVAETALQRIMDYDVENVIGAARHERSPDRLTYRNGYRDRTLETRLGALELKVPKLRTGASYFPPFLEPRRTLEKALTAVIQEAWVAGVSTRRVEDLVQAMGMSGISKSQVSKLCKEIDERVSSFLERPLEGEWPYLWLDATYLKQRQGGRIVSVAVIIAVAANTEGRREIIGLSVGQSEAAAFWIDFLRSLARRGLKGVKLVISDAHEGLKAAIAQVMGATWQRCRVHTMRNLLSRVPKAQQSRVATMIREVFVQPSQDKARELWRAIAASAHNSLPKLSEAMEAAEDDVLAYMTFPAAHRQKLHSTNTLERLNKEVKRRADVVGIFPGEASIIRLVGAVLMEQNDEWQLQHRYLSLEPLADLSQGADDDQILLVPPAAAPILTPRTA